MTKGSAVPVHFLSSRCIRDGEGLVVLLDPVKWFGAGQCELPKVAQCFSLLGMFSRGAEWLWDRASLLHMAYCFQL